MNDYDGLVPKPTTEPNEEPKMKRKRIWKSKTFWVNMLTMAAGVATYFQTDVVKDNPEAVTRVFGE